MKTYFNTTESKPAVRTDVSLNIDMTVPQNREPDYFIINEVIEREISTPVIKESWDEALDYAAGLIRQALEDYEDIEDTKELLDAICDDGGCSIITGNYYYHFTAYGETSGHNNIDWRITPMWLDMFCTIIGKLEVPDYMVHPDKQGEFDFITSNYVDYRDIEVTRTLWTAFCWHHDMTVDNNEYDSWLLMLWDFFNSSVVRVNPFENYDSFSEFMLENLV